MVKGWQAHPERSYIIFRQNNLSQDLNDSPGIQSIENKEVNALGVCGGKVVVTPLLRSHRMKTVSCCNGHEIATRGKTATNDDRR